MRWLLAAPRGAQRDVIACVGRTDPGTAQSLAGGLADARQTEEGQVSQIAKRAHESTNEPEQKRIFEPACEPADFPRCAIMHMVGITPMYSMARHQIV